MSVVALPYFDLLALALAVAIIAVETGLETRTVRRICYLELNNANDFHYILKTVNAKRCLAKNVF